MHCREYFAYALTPVELSSAEWLALLGHARLSLVDACFMQATELSLVKVRKPSSFPELSEKKSLISYPLNSYLCNVGEPAELKHIIERRTRKQQ